MNRYLKTCFIIIFFIYGCNPAWSDASGSVWYSLYNPDCQACSILSKPCPAIGCLYPGNYVCSPQTPPLKEINDPRVASLVKSGQCHYMSMMTTDPSRMKAARQFLYCANYTKYAGLNNTPSSQSFSDKLKFLSDLSDYYLSTKHDQIDNYLVGLRLAHEYDFGIGTSIDRDKATKIYLQLATSGFPLAMYAVSVRYMYGVGVKQDINQGKYWLNKLATMKFDVTPSDEEAINMLKLQLYDPEKFNQMSNAKIWENVSYCGELLIQNHP